MKYALIATICLLPVFASGDPSSDIYTIDLSKSTISVTAFEDGMMGKVRPTHAIEVKRFGGRVRFTSGDEARATVEFQADAKSLENVEKGISEFERSGFQATLQNAVLESEKFPQITFRSTGITDIRPAGDARGFTLHGDLTVHGVTRRASLPVVMTVSGDQLRATGEATIKQTDFDMKPYSGGLGLIKIRDEVKITFTVIARG